MKESPSAREGQKRTRISPCCLTIAGSDSGGNAGIQADLRAFRAYGLHGCTVLTALTAQNPHRVSAIHPVSADFVIAQLDAVLGAYAVSALKTGMVGSAETVEALCEKLQGHPRIRKVVDPVMVATSGARLASRESVAAFQARLFPLADIITPNIPEAETLTGREIRSERDVREAAKRLNGTYGCKVLVKGGHRKGKRAKDILFDGSAFFAYGCEWVENPVSTHGTGCTLAAALTANLALGRDLCDAVQDAKAYVHRAIVASYLAGERCGVLGF